MLFSTEEQIDFVKSESVFASSIGASSITSTASLSSSFAISIFSLKLSEWERFFAACLSVESAILNFFIIENLLKKNKALKQREAVSRTNDLRGTTLIAAFKATALQDSSKSLAMITGRP